MSAAATLVAVCAWCSGCSGAQQASGECRRPFDTGAWRAAGASDDRGERARREPYARRLVRCRTLIGETPAEVTKLLGPTSETYTTAGDVQLYYGIGPRAGLDTGDDQGLTVHIRHNRVSDAAIS